MKKIIYYENGDRVAWNGHADVSYHQAKVTKEVDLPSATDVEMASLKVNPNNDSLIATIQARKKVVT